MELPSVETLSKATSYLSTDMTCFTSLHTFIIYINTAKLEMVRTLGKLSLDSLVCKLQMQGY